MDLELPTRLRSFRLRDTEGPGSFSSNMNNDNLRQREAKTTGSVSRMLSNVRRHESEQSPDLRRPSSKIIKDRLKEIFKFP